MRAEEFVKSEVEAEGGLPEITKAVELIQEYREKEWYDSKRAILDSWDISDDGIYELVIAVFTVVLSNEILTYQTAVGLLERKIKLPEELHRIEIIADVIGLICMADLIDITSKTGEYHEISTEYVIENIPEPESHLTKFYRPQPIEGNFSDELGSIILGHSMNRHDGFVRLSHLNRMAQIRFKLDQDFIQKYEEEPKKAPDTEEKEAQWEFFKEKSTEKYEEAGDKYFYIPHKYDSRGRVYADSYYLNPQGISYKKAIIQLADAEVVEGV